MTEYKCKDENNFIARVVAVFGCEKYQHSASERRVLQDGFFRFIKGGDVYYVKKWLDEDRADILACDKNGKNVLQVFCKSVGLSENRWKDVDFDPQKELSKTSLYLYDVLTTHYNDALEKQRQEEIEFMKKQIQVGFSVPKQILEENKISVLSVLCLVPVRTVQNLKDVLDTPRSKRPIVRARRFVRKIIPTVLQKRRTK